MSNEDYQGSRYSNDRNDRGGDRGGDRNRGRGGYRGGGGGGRGGDDRRGIPLSALDAATTEASRKAIGAAIEVHKLLGPGYDETAYTNALKMELDALSVSYKHGHNIPVMYRDRKVGEAATDLFIDGKFFLEIMARPGPVTTYERLELRAKLKAADLELGLIINFAERRLKDGLVRVVNIDKITKERGITLDEGEDDADSEFDH